MPGPYSLDLRRKAVLAYERGGQTQKEVAEEFSIGYRTLKEWLFLKKTTGDVKPKEHSHRGPLPIIDDKGLLFIKQLIDNKPDILVFEIRKLYKQKFKVNILNSMVTKAFRKLKFTPKEEKQICAGTRAI